MAEVLDILITAKDEASNVAQEIGDSFRGAFKTGIVAGAAGLAIFGGALGFSIKSAMEAQEIQAELAQVIESTGGAAGVTADEALSLASSLQSVTKFSDESIARGETLLLTFTNIGENVFPLATEASLNMAETFGSVDSAAIQLGKALNDPVAGVSALQEVGVSFTEDQKKMIAAMVETGDIAGAQSVILDELDREFGGVARAAGETFAGKLAILKNRLMDVFQVIGMAMLPALTKLINFILAKGVPAAEALAKRLAPAFAYLGTVVSVFVETLLGGGGLIEALRGVFTYLGEGETVIGSLLELFGMSRDSAMQFAMAIDAVAAPLLNLVENIIIPFVEEHGESFKKSLMVIGGLLGGAVILGGIAALIGALTGIVGVILLISAAVTALVLAWDMDFLGIKSTAIEVFNAVSPFIQEVAQQLGILLPAAIVLLRAFWETQLKPAFEGLRDILVNDVFPVLTQVAQFFIAGLPVAIAFLTGIWNSVLKPAIEGLATIISTIALPAIQDLFGWLQDSIPQAFQVARMAWDTVLKPGLEALQGFITTQVVPVLEDFIEWVGHRISEAFTVFKSAWETILRPGLDAIWAFVRDNVLPILEEVAKKFLTDLGAAFAVFKSAWETVLKPGLDALWTLFSEDLLPRLLEFGNFLQVVIPDAIDYVGTFLSNLWGRLDGLEVKLQPLITKFQEVTDLLQGAFSTAISSAKDLLSELWGALNDIWDILKKVIGKIGEFTDGLSGIADSLPDWMIPGSPTPFELGLRGINEAMRELAEITVPRLNQNLSAPGLTRNPAENIRGLVASSGGVQTVINNNLILNSNATSENLLTDFELMKTWVGA